MEMKRPLVIMEHFFKVVLPKLLRFKKSLLEGQFCWLFLLRSVFVGLDFSPYIPYFKPGLVAIPWVDRLLLNWRQNKTVPTHTPISLTMIFHQIRRNVPFIDRRTERVTPFHQSLFDFHGLSFSLMGTERFFLGGWAETQSSLTDGDCWECCIELPQGFLRCPDE